MQIKYCYGSLNLVPDSLSRFNEEDATEAVSGISEGEKTSDTWYERMFKQVTENPQDWPNWKVLRSELYRYNTDSSLDLEVNDHEAWKLVLPKEKRTQAA